MKNTKRLFAIILAAAMLAALLAGCSGSEAPAAEEELPSQTQEASAPQEEAAPEQSAESTESAATQEPPQEETEPEETQPFSVVAQRDPSKGVLLPSDATVEDITANISPELPGNLPLTDSGEDITFMTEFNEQMYKTVPNGYADCIPFQVAEELTGVKVEFVEVGSGAWTERFNLLVVSGDYPDIVAAKTDYSGGDDKGIADEFILPLNDYLEEYCPNYWGLLSNGSNLINAMTDSGYVAGFYGITSGNGQPNGKGTGFIRQDWLEDLELEKPVTYDQMYEVLKAFQTEKQADEPIMWPSTLVSTNEGLVSGYGVAGNASIDHRGTNIPYYVVDGQIHYGLLEDGYREFMEMCRKWYDEGLISPEFLTKNENSRDAAYITTITEGHSGIFFVDNQEVESMVTMGQELTSSFAVEAITDPVKNEGDIDHFAEISTELGNKAYWVTTGARNIPLVLSWCDFWYSNVGSDLCEWGLEGVTFTYNDEGSRELTDFGTEMFITTTNRDLRTVYSLNCVGYVTLQKNSTDSEFVLKCNEIRSVNNDSAYTLPNISLTAEESERHSAVYNDIATYVVENLAKFFVGERSMDQWDEFTDQIRSMGIDECIEIYQAAYDRYAARSAK